MLITLTKLGRNCQVVFYNQSNDNTQTFQEDSANIECTYNVLNDVVSVAIKGRTQATTESIVNNDVLYINTGTGDILIKTYADFLINYALLFLNAGGTGGGTNPTSLYIPYNNGGTFADSYIINDTFNNNLKTTNSSILGDTGLLLDFQNDNYFLGDYAEKNYGIFLNVDDFNGYIRSHYSGNFTGLLIDFPNNIYKLGDYDFLTHNGTSLIIDDDAKFIVTKNNGNEFGLKLDFANNIYKLGDFDNIQNTTHFIVSDASKNISTNYNGNAYGIELDFQNDLFAFGDMHGVTNSNYLMIDNAGKTIKTYAHNIEIGLSLNFLDNVSYLGDFNSIVNNCNIQIDYGNNVILHYSKVHQFFTSGGGAGLELDGNNNITTLGDFNGDIYATNLKIDSSFETVIIKTRGIEKGLKLDLYNNDFYFGDWDSGACFLQINSTIGYFRTTYLNNTVGLQLNFSTNIYKFGDFDGNHENSFIFIDDNKATLRLWFHNSPGAYNFANLPAYDDNADALANGLIVGDIYRHANGDTDQLNIVH